MLLPPDMREWVPNDDMVHFVIAAVEQMDLRMARAKAAAMPVRQAIPSIREFVRTYTRRCWRPFGDSGGIR